MLPLFVALENANIDNNEISKSRHFDTNQTFVRHNDIKNSGQVSNLTGINGNGNVIQTHDTSSMKNQNWK